MSERTFPETTIPYGDKTAKAMRIGCACCDAVAYFPFQTGSIRKPPSAASQHFLNKGWVVGNSPKKDFCPRHASPAKRKGTKTMDSNITTPVADKPREMGREDRAIIFDKLNEVYGKDAYKSPWTDAAVAKDLGVPRDWVSTMRDDMFGPAGSNPLFDEFLTATSRLEEQCGSFAAKFEAATKAAEMLAADYAELRKQVDVCRMLERRVQREIGR
jgi:hypothetical protein